MKFGKKLLSVLLTVMMIVSMINVTAFAGEEPTYVAKIGETEYSTLAEAVKNAKDGDTITLLTDIKDAGNISLPAGVTLDGGTDKHTISGNSAVHVNAAGGTVQNVVFNNIHNSITVDDETCSYYRWDKGSKIGNLSAIYASSLSGALTVTGCSFDNIDWDAIQVTPVAGSAITITGNTFSHTGTENIQVRYIHVESAGSVSSTLTVTGNKFYESKESHAITNIGIWGVSNITSGKLTGNYFEWDKNDGFVDTHSALKTNVYYISGGVSVSYLFPALATPDAAEATLTPDYYSDSKGCFSADGDTANNGSTNYPTVAAAIEAGKTSIYLLADIKQDFTIPSGKTITLYPYKGSNYYTVGGTITVDGTLKISSGTATGSTATIINKGTTTLNCNAATGMKVYNYGTLNITGGAPYNVADIINEGGTVIITGGTFTTDPTATGFLAPWYIAEKQSDETFKVRKMNLTEAAENGAVASKSKTGSEYYSSLNEHFSETYVYLQKNLRFDLSR